MGRIARFATPGMTLTTFGQSESPALTTSPSSGTLQKIHGFARDVSGITRTGIRTIVSRCTGVRVPRSSTVLVQAQGMQCPTATCFTRRMGALSQSRVLLLYRVFVAWQGARAISGCRSKVKSLSARPRDSKEFPQAGVNSNACPEEAHRHGF